MNTFIKNKANTIVVSCQSRPGNPFYADEHVFMKIVDSVIQGGATALRIDTAKNIIQIKSQYPDAVVIGLKKIMDPQGPSLGWITPTFEDARELIDANADIVAIEGSFSLHPNDSSSFAELVSKIKNYRKHCIVMADIGSFEEAIRAVDCGVDMIGTTLAQADSRAYQITWKEHMDLVAKMHAAFTVPIVCEGGVIEPAQAEEAFAAGASFVVVGKAIVDPVFNTQRFLSVTKTYE